MRRLVGLRKESYLAARLLGSLRPHARSKFFPSPNIRETNVHDIRRFRRRQ